ncbi:MAG: Hachiman antiphage defense system protein HamA [Terriglobia bacterium]
MTSGFMQFVQSKRSIIQGDRDFVRVVYHSVIRSNNGGNELAVYLADRMPFFYREPSKIIEALSSQYFVSTVKETLARLPDSATFQESHFAEISSAIFCEEVLGLKRLYSKLSLLTAENTNPHKMDILFCNPCVDPVEFILCEVKSSMKCAAEGLPPGHDKSCFADLFRSFNKYQEKDLEFDLAAAKDRIEVLPTSQRNKILSSLEPYAERSLKYAGFIVIDSGTKDDSEINILGTRKNDKKFDVDLVSVESLRNVAERSYQILKEIRDKCTP